MGLTVLEFQHTVYFAVHTYITLYYYSCYYYTYEKGAILGDKKIPRDTEIKAWFLQCDKRSTESEEYQMCFPTSFASAVVL